VVNIAFYEFSGFRFVAVNSVYKLQFFKFIIFYAIAISYGTDNKEVNQLVPD